MNIFKYIFCFFIFLIIIGCSYEAAPLAENQLCISFVGINFGGDWTAYKNNNINTFHLISNLDTDIGNPIDINAKLNYDDNTKPSVDIDPKANYILDGKGNVFTTTKLKVKTDFDERDVNNNKIKTFKTFEGNKSIKNCTDNDITLTYNADNDSVINIEVKDERFGWVSDAYQYNVSWEFAHKATNNDGSKNGNINLIVMAEGYRADQMWQYRDYVKDAFANTANFHYTDGNINNPHIHVNNDFFARYWDKINVIMMETISPHEGIDNARYEDKVQNILGLNKELKYPMFSRINAIMSWTKPNDMNIWDADAIIILVNDPNIWAYSWAYGMEINHRNMQPIHCVIIQAPVKNPKGDYFKTTDTNFHSYYTSPTENKGVITNAIAHELGHALARLQDEYSIGGTNISYCPWFRNIDNDTDYKWIGLNNRGYNNTSIMRNPLGEFKGALYKENENYRPTEIGTMRGTELSPNLQYGPVNTYHLTASFKVRIGEINPTDLNCGNDNFGYEWSGYSLDQFKNDWPPSKF